jgi:hypothetical protein
MQQDSVAVETAFGPAATAAAEAAAAKATLAAVAIFPLCG